MKKLTSLVLATLATAAVADTHNFDINVSKQGAVIQPTMYGIFLEDINYGADGGLYAEMVKNRSFEFPQHLMGWRAYGKFEVRDDGPFDRNPHYVRLSYAGHPHKKTGIENEGFFGFSTKKDATYRFSVWARCPEGGKSKLSVMLVDNDTMGERQEQAGCQVTVEGKEWKKYTAEIKTKKNQDDLSLRIFLRGAVTTDVEHVSLFPTDTWMGRENGMRKDIAQALADLKPGVFRFPGGCIVEGTDLETRYQWKNSVGPVENRPLNENRWHYTFDQRFFPDYFQSYGLGFFEYFQLCEDFGCEALPVLSCGLACQYQNDIRDEARVHVSLDNLQPYIQDALDLIEFANGDTTTTWGKLRADMGHPKPFNLKYIGIGNEQWDYDDNAAFTTRLQKFLDVLQKQHPEINYIGTTGPGSEGHEFEMLQPKMKEMKVDLYDEHFYRNEQWFLNSGLRYDNYDRKGPAVFAGEYACHGSGKKWNHWEASLYEAAFMTGFERNADIVHMTTYAPLLAHIKGWQWRPDLIWYDNSRVMKSCSYYIQQLYGLYRGDRVLSLKMNNAPVAGQTGQDGLFASACYDKTRNAVIVKVANTSDAEQNIQFNFAGKKKDLKGFKSVECISMSSFDLNAENTLDNPNLITPQTEVLDPATTSATMAAKTFQIYVFYKN